MFFPRAPSFLNSRLLGYVTIGYIEPSSHYLGNWCPRVFVWGYKLEEKLNRVQCKGCRVGE